MFETSENGFFGDIDDKTLLKEVRHAIRTILFGGQSYRIGGREMRRADLSDLYRIKNELEAAETAEDNAGPGRHTAVGYFDRR